MSAQTANAPVTATAALPDNETPPTLDIGASGVSVETCIAAIRAGDQWHNNMLRLVGHWISRGWSDVEILTAAEPMTLTGYTVDATRRDVSQMIMGGRSRWNVPNPDAWLEPPREAISLDLNSSMASTLPRCRAVVGSSVVPCCAVISACSSRRPASANRPMGSPAPWQLPRDAISPGKPCTSPSRRGSTIPRTMATSSNAGWALFCSIIRLHFDDIRGRIALNSGADRPLLFARADRKELVIRQPDVDACIAQIREHDIGLFVVDPFIETHEVDENSNRQIKVVAGMFREVARSANCSVLLVHHTAKPPQGTSDGHAGNMNTARGASALVGVARVVETLFSMSEADADEVGVSDDDRHLYLRLDDAKANLGPTRGEPAWYRRQSVTIANGDEVGVLVPHEFPLLGALSVITAEQDTGDLRGDQRRWDEGEPFSSSPNSDRCIFPYLEHQGFRRKRRETDVGELAGDPDAPVRNLQHQDQGEGPEGGQMARMTIAEVTAEVVRKWCGSDAERKPPIPPAQASASAPLPRAGAGLRRARGVLAWLGGRRKARSGWSESLSSETYRIQAMVDGLDQLALAMERKWGVDRLRLLVSDLLRAKFDEQKDRLDQALATNNEVFVRAQVGGMRRAWEGPRSSRI